MKKLAQHRVRAHEINLDQLDPAFRKATLNMALATLASDEVLKKIPDVPRDQISFVLATHFGEVATTMDFLETYRDSQLARPLLFQNSLHNSSLGFACIHLGLTGPAITVSADRETHAAALSTAENLLGLTPYVLVCYVDCLPAPLAPYYLASFPFLKEHLDQASCELYARSHAAV